ncbi:MAG: hypothetical protein WBS24_16530 [Terriglobales bacterium]
MMRSSNFKTAVLAEVLAALAFVVVAPQFLQAQYNIGTIAGGGPNGLAALSSSIGYADAIAFDSAGNAYIADSWSSRVLEVSASTGNVTVVAGNGAHGYSGDGGPATSATLDGPEGVAVDGSGNIFIADTGNSLIREVTISNGNIQTVAGSVTLGAGYSGDGGAATSAQLNFPVGIFLDSSGDIFIADSANAAIREVVGTTINTVAGNSSGSCADPTTACGDGGPATSAQLDFPEGVFVDTAGNLYIADTYTARVRVVNTGTAPITIATVTIPAGDIQTIAGAYYQSEGGTECGAYISSGAALSTQLCAPSGVAVDNSGDIFFADSYNSVIREIVAGSANVATFAGNGTPGYSGDTGAATSAQLNFPNNLFVDSAGDIYIADTDNYVIREVSASTNDIDTTIGNNTAADSGDGGAAVDAELSTPGGVFVDASANVFIADSFSSVVREVVATNGKIKTVAGDVKNPCLVATDLCGDGGPAASAQFDSPSGVALDGAGNIYIADTDDNRIREVTAAGNVSTVAGTGGQCAAPFSSCGDGGAATSALLFQPFGVAVDGAGNIFVADTDDHAIRVVNMGIATLTLAGVQIATGQIATVAGNGTQCPPPTTQACGDGGAATSAQLNFPGGLFVDSSDNIYIADSGNNRIRAVNTGTASVSIGGITIPAGAIATIAGSGTEGYAGDGAAAANAQLSGPNGVFVDGSGNIFISDTGNDVIREVVAGSTTSGSWDIATVAGNNSNGFSGDGGTATGAQLNGALGVFGDTNGNLYVADTNNSRIRELVLSAGSTPSATPPPSQTTSPGGSATFTIELKANTGNPKYPITLSCAQSTLPAGATCSFSPATITPGPLAVPFTLTVTVPTASASIDRTMDNKTIVKPMHSRMFAFALFPLAGVLLTGVGLRKKRNRWLLLAGLAVVLILLNACGGSSSPSGTTYNVQVQGTWHTQSSPVTITTASLIIR